MSGDELAEARPFPNRIQPFRVERGWIRGRMVRIGTCYQEILAQHNYPQPVAIMLGETLVLAVALASALKYEGNFKLQAQGDGPVSILVADFTSTGGLRGYARYRENAFEGDKLVGQNLALDGSDLVPRLLGGGYLAFTVDQGPERVKYQGIAALEGAGLAECAHTYFRQSEQLETAIKLAAETNYGPPRASALMIQRMPGDNPPEMPDEDAEEAWREAVILMSSMSAAEMLDPHIPTREILYRMYHEQGIRAYDARSIDFHCRCSRERVAETLSQFDATELNDMVTDEGMVVVTCEICQEYYAFNEREIAALPRF